MGGLLFKVESEDKNVLLLMLHESNRKSLWIIQGLDYSAKSNKTCNSKSRKDRERANC